MSFQNGMLNKYVHGVRSCQKVVQNHHNLRNYCAAFSQSLTEVEIQTFFEVRCMRVVLRSPDERSASPCKSLQHRGESTVCCQTGVVVCVVSEDLRQVKRVNR